MPVESCPEGAGEFDGVEFYFCEKAGGAMRFLVSGSVDGRLPLERAASLLAMHCLMSGQPPSEYRVMVPAGTEITRAVAAQAEELLQAGRAIALPVELSRREHKVFRGILQNLANKEIADLLCLSERTVKYYVSSLLAKFGVQSRGGVMRKAMGMFAPPDFAPSHTSIKLSSPCREGSWGGPVGANSLRKGDAPAPSARLRRRLMPV